MYGILKKKYGQNFLIDKNVQKKICNLIQDRNLNIIEIGPGDGKLTQEILNHKPKELKIIEIDSSLIPELKLKFNEHKNVKIINQDIMEYQSNEISDLIISNLPYNISSQILVKICLMKNLPSNLILMFQKEFAQRLLDQKLNSLNSLVNCFYDIDTNFYVSKNCFRPIPKINSSVLKFSKKENILLKREEIIKFIEFKRFLFSHKRKKLGKLLKTFNYSDLDFDYNERVENINLQQLLNIFREINL